MTLSTSTLNIESDAQMNSEASVPYSQYRCPKCRIVLFETKDILPHETHATPHERFDRARNKSFLSGALPMKDGQPAPCGVFNIQVQPWMPQDRSEGKLICSNGMGKKICGAKLGDYQWHGAPCTCGVWMTPAFLIPKSKVDRVMIRSD
jgi:dual specificity phosphatase 12